MSDTPLETNASADAARPYPLPNASDDSKEMDRLDAMHNAFTEYFGGRLCEYPLESERPGKILELGCGSGAWAIQAATQIPDAQVVAVDVAPLPARPLPPNLVFQLADLTKPLPFEHGTFDIVHARWVMCHVTDAPDVLSRVSQLVKPGGLLLIEDGDMRSFAQSGGPATSACVSKILELWVQRGADFEVARKFKTILDSTGLFSEIDLKPVDCPFNFKSDAYDPRIFPLGREIKETARKATNILLTPGKGFAENGLTADVVKAHVEELEDIHCETRIDLYFCVARRTQ
ncbi:S-adenosyl-L-methionine-dependent methyltransferase [Roridomyces roridus]|uniref:S-adenosyl-L-methionine-dependent methyltransferase n=1 Tax=Roridomyces roridus TaxID=1738132 RepID=A0AAD7BSE1_9AGAR|nr:S-adenosyl-L-methionine-dependent methyltransferase [Roridomyces roridus]